MTIEQDGDQAHWMVEKKIPLALILTVLTNTFAGIWFASKMDSRIAALEYSFEKMDGVQIRQEMIKHQVGRIETKLDRIIERSLEQ